MAGLHVHGHAHEALVFLSVSLSILFHGVGQVKGDLADVLPATSFPKHTSGDVVVLGLGELSISLHPDSS